MASATAPSPITEILEMQQRLIRLTADHLFIRQNFMSISATLSSNIEKI
jgi:hypothetical protein